MGTRGVSQSGVTAAPGLAQAGRRVFHRRWHPLLRRDAIQGVWKGHASACEGLVTPPARVGDHLGSAAHRQRSAADASRYPSLQILARLPRPESPRRRCHLWKIRRAMRRRRTPSCCRDRWAIAVAVDCGVMPSTANCAREIGFSRVRPRRSNIAGMSCGDASRNVRVI
jgi:hypothetical protein